MIPPLGSQKDTPHLRRMSLLGVPRRTSSFCSSPPQPSLTAPSWLRTTESRPATDALRWPCGLSGRMADDAHFLHPFLKKREWAYSLSRHWRGRRQWRQPLNLSDKGLSWIHASFTHCFSTSVCHAEAACLVPCVALMKNPDSLTSSV